MELLSCLDLMERPSSCPGCGKRAPQWTWVRIDGLRILTHDGDLICPADKTFGALTGPEPKSAEVAA